MFYSHQDFQRDLSNLLQQEELTVKERAFFQEAQDGLVADQNMMKLVQELKNQLSPLASSGQLSAPALAFLTELSRRVPATGVSSMWNFLVRKKKEQ